MTNATANLDEGTKRFLGNLFPSASPTPPPSVQPNTPTPSTSVREGKLDPVTERAVSNMLAASSLRVNEDGAIKTWITSKINSALTASNVPADKWDTIEDAVLSAALSGKLGDGQPSEETATAILSLVKELAGVAAAPAPGPASSDDATIPPEDIGVPPTTAKLDAEGPVEEPPSSEETPEDASEEISDEDFEGIMGQIDKLVGDAEEDNPPPIPEPGLEGDGDEDFEPEIPAGGAKEDDEEDEDEEAGGKTAKKKGVDEDDVDPDQLKKGIETEKEHTDDEEEAKRIALDHLAEDPEYYTKLAKMEKGAKKESSEIVDKVIDDYIGERRFPGLDSEVYTRREKMPKWNTDVGPLMDPDAGGRLLRRRLPKWGKEDHIAAARHHLRMSDKRGREWGDLQRQAHQQAFGKDPEFHDYRISGIGRDEYSDEFKDRLSKAAVSKTGHKYAAAAHWKAAGKRRPVGEASESVRLIDGMGRRVVPTRQGIQDALLGPTSIVKTHDDLVWIAYDDSSEEYTEINIRNDEADRSFTFDADTEFEEALDEFLRQCSSLGPSESKKAPKKAIEAYGVMGMSSKRWRKTFKSVEDMNKWVDAHDAEVQGTRDAVKEDLDDMGREMEPQVADKTCPCKMQEPCNCQAPSGIRVSIVPGTLVLLTLESRLRQGKVVDVVGEEAQVDVGDGRLEYVNTRLLHEAVGGKELDVEIPKTEEGIRSLLDDIAKAEVLREMLV